MIWISLIMGHSVVVVALRTTRMITYKKCERYSICLTFIKFFLCIRNDQVILKIKASNH
jgi:hypothetical protein